MGLIEDIGDGDVAVDTAVFIYFIEEESQYLPIIRPLFAEADKGKRRLVTSSLTLLEVLVVPYRTGNASLADRYEALLTRSRGLQLIEVTREQLKAAAQLRATTGIKTPDALQMAAALGARCGTFVTNDRRIPQVPGLRVIELKSYAVGGSAPGGLAASPWPARADALLGNRHDLIKGARRSAG